MKRRPFFLLEVLIAAALVGVFAFLSIHGAFRLARQQKKLLKEIEGSIDADRRRMKVIADCWSKVETYVNDNDDYTAVEGGFCVKSTPDKTEKHYLLKVKEGKPKQRRKSYCYLVTKHDRGNCLDI